MTHFTIKIEDLPRHIPDIQNCLDNLDYATEQQVYQPQALQQVTELVQLYQSHDYDWNPEASIQELKITKLILSALGINGSIRINSDHILSYLKNNKI
jgi:hypothetical protein